MKMEDLKSTTIICSGGLDSNQNWLDLNDTNIGVASELVNFEPSLFGGYRRINGFTVLEETDNGEVDPTGAEGKILGVFIYDNKILAARKQQSGATYEFYQYVSGSSWSKYTTGLTLTSTGVNRIRYATFNFDGTEKIIFVDGVNNATLFDGTNWINIDPSATGADYANSGGLQAIGAPNYVAVFRNHLFIAKCSGSCNIVAHSAPNAEYNWTSAGGAGQINAGLDIVQIKPFRDELYVFGDRQIKKVVVDSSAAFVRQDVTNDIGCIASDSVMEISGDLLFLSEDGLRPIAATARINDIELANVSKKIQQQLKEYIDTYDMNAVVSVIVPNKSQFRVFFTPESVVEENAPGIIGALTAGLVSKKNDIGWEFGNLRGIKVACATHGRFGAPLEQHVLHGDYNGIVYRQEVGNSFGGSDIFAQYATPYLHFGQANLRKTPHQILVFTKPEGAVTLNTALNYDWGLSTKINPNSYVTQTQGNPAIYGVAVYGTATYGGATVPTMLTNVQGSGYSVKITFSTEDQSAPYSIQGMVIKYEVNGYK